MINFKEETLHKLAEYGHTKDDVQWVGSYDGQYVISMDDFLSLADFDYDNGFGGCEIARDLVVVGHDNTWWLERRSYDGSEWWEFQTAPMKQDKPQPLTKLQCFYGLEFLQEIHEGDEEEWL